MKTYIAFVYDKERKNYTTITGEYETKVDFIADLRKNGYRVNPDKVKEAEVFNYIVNYTNMTPWDWKLTKADIQDLF